MTDFIEKLKEEFPDNFCEGEDIEEMAGEQLLGSAPSLFNVKIENIEDARNPQPEIDRAVRKMFESNPKAKIFKVGFKVLEKGGMLTISGKF